MAPDDGPPPPVAGRPADPTEVLKRLQDSALELIAGLDRAPRSLRIRSDQVEIEVEWPDQDPTPAGRAVAAGSAAPRAEDSTDDRAENATGMYVLAQTVGVFYQSSGPTAEPFVRSGDIVTPGQQLGVIEAMKLLIPVESDVTGRIVDVLVSDGAAVEYGDRLFEFEPVGG